MNPGSSPAFRAARRLLPIVVALVLGSGLAELLLQVAARVSPRIAYLLSPPWSRNVVPDSLLGFRLSRYAEGHDAWGYRNAAVPSKTGVLTLGDSFTYGFGALASDSWPAQLSRILEVPVYNGGVGGYGPCEYSILLDRLLVLDPEIVIVAVHTGNDLADAYRAVYGENRCGEMRNDSSAVQEKLAELDRAASLKDIAQARGWGAESPQTNSGPGGVRRWVAHHSMLYSLLRSVRHLRWHERVESDSFEQSLTRPGRIAFRGGPVQRTVFKPVEAFAVDVDLADLRVRAGLEIAERALVSMHQRVAARGKRFLVALILDKPATFAPLVGDSSGLPVSFFRLAALEEEVASRLGEFLRGRGVEVVPTGPAIREGLRRGAQLYPESDDHHLNRLGYGIVARTIADLVRSP